MTTYATNNALGSTDPRDLYDNSQNFDFALNDITQAIWKDRFGRDRRSWYGLESIVSEAASSFGYITLVDVSFTTGATVNLNELLLNPSDNFYYKWTGSFPLGGKVVPPNSSPDSTGGQGPGKWLNVGDSTVRGLLEVTANVVGSNNYSNFPGIGGTISAGHDYLYNGILYTTVGESGEVLSVSGNAVTTDNGTAFLLDKRWPVNDVRAWGVQNDVQADLNFKNAVTFINAQPGGKRTVYVPPIALLLNGIELRDLANLTIHFDGTYLIGITTSNISAMIDIVNSHTASITGSFIAAGSSKYTYAIRGRAGLPSTIAPLTGIFTSFDMAGAFKFNTWNCALGFGDGEDKQVSEINLKSITTNKVNCCAEVNGSQTIVNIEGSCVCEPVSGMTYKKGAFNVIGGVLNHTAGEAVSSIDAGAPIVNISQSSSVQYSNPFGSARFVGVHIETVSKLVSIVNSSGITGSSFSGHSDITFSVCSGAMLNGSIPLIDNQVSDYAGTVNIENSCNFYSSTSRSAVIVYSVSPDMNVRIGDEAFRYGFTPIAENISPQVNWHHSIRPIAYMEAASVSISSNATIDVTFPSRLSDGDYKYYYQNTNSNGFNVGTHLRQIDVSVYMPSSGAALTVGVVLNGVEYFNCLGGGSVTIPGNKLPIGAELRFTCRNSSGSTVTLANTARVVISAANY
ncbi:TPA: hypothetical protein QCI11_003009 [Enterobacter ludwigii]|nr:hypothetical protein [Enterobacter ludwigii]